MTYPSIMYFNNNPEFTFVLGSQCISLEQTQTHNKELRVEYNPSNDSLYVRDNRKNPELTPEQMICLRIPKEEIYKGYASIIDKNLANERIHGSLTDSDNKEKKVLRKIPKRLFNR